jgi:CRISPR/Cas system-associated exonuclease Cas4 (RecB family)
MNKLCEKSVDWEKNGYKLMWSRLDCHMPEDIFRRRVEIAKKRWKKLKRILDEMEKPKGRA